MNLSGILVVAKPDGLAQVREALDAIPGVEVHQVDEASGRVIVVQEAADIHAEIEGLKAIKALPHVVMAEMVYHYIADDQQVYDSLPPELAEEPGQACSVPAYLQD
ncbi:MAG: chaperone NapD [Thiobacillaceae bacterium]|jgi:nitrate reductase NapD|nr:chaperone NapD [Thiobacillaceae bacterium]